MHSSFRILFLLASSISLIFVEAAHSARAKVVFSKQKDHDKTTSKFDNDGRLVQTEYGFESIKRASTTTVVNLGELDSDDAILVVLRGEQISRLSLEDDLWLVTVGLVGDSNFLLRLLKQFVQDFRKTYGEAPSVTQVAKQAAELQHQLTMLETYRPLGVAAIVMGIDPREKKPKIYRTEPGGILEECYYYSTGKNGDKVSMDLAKTWQQIQDGESQASSLDKLLQPCFGSHDSEENSKGTTVWILRQESGKTIARCYSGVTKGNCADVVARQAETSSYAG